MAESDQQFYELIRDRLMAFDLHTRRALAWASPCVPGRRYGCGASASTPCLHEGEPWHSYRTMPDGSKVVNYNSFPFHTARWVAAGRLSPLDAMAVVSDGGGFDPADLTPEAARRYIEDMNSQH